MKNKFGFTLVEIIVVIVILSVLMAISVPIAFNYFDDVHKQKIISEAESVLRIAETYSSSNQSSLAGTYIDNDTNVDMSSYPNILQNIVKKSHGNGQIIKLVYHGHQVEELEYQLEQQTVVYKKNEDKFIIQ